MIGIALIREDPEAVKRAVARKGEPTDAVDRVFEADARRRAIEAEVNELRAQRNEGNRQVGELMRTGQRDDVAALKTHMAELSAQIDGLDAELSEVERSLEREMLLIPNLPHESVPNGTGPDDNPLVRAWGDPLPAGGTPPHWEIAERLRLFDLERGAKVAGSWFILSTGAGARLLRSLIGLILEMTQLAG